MGQINLLTDKNQIVTNSPTQSVICSFQTNYNSRGHFIVKVRAVAMNDHIAKAWILSARYSRTNNSIPEISTLTYTLVDGDALSSSWDIAIMPSVDGLISIQCLGSLVETAWIGEFDAVETH